MVMPSVGVGEEEDQEEEEDSIRHGPAAGRLFSLSLSIGSRRI